MQIGNQLCEKNNVMNVFKVKYWKKNKPNGTRKFNIFGSDVNYEKVLFDGTLSHLCERTYFHNYEWFMLNEHVFVKRLKANSFICEYEVSLFDMHNTSKLLEVYNVEIECIENDQSCDLFNEENQLKEPLMRKIEKEKHLTDWFLKEPRAIRSFLLMLTRFENLKALKKSGYISKATYYRNLNICEEKGLIKNGKITRRIQVKK